MRGLEMSCYFRPSDNTASHHMRGLENENYIDDYLDELLDDCGYLPKDLPYWIEIDWQATYDNMKEDYNEIELNGNTFYVR